MYKIAEGRQMRGGTEMDGIPMGCDYVPREVGRGVCGGGVRQNGGPDAPHH